MAMPPSFGARLHADDAISEGNSSSVSSPPISPHSHGFSDTIHVANPQFSSNSRLGGGVASANSAHSSLNANNAAFGANGKLSTLAHASTNGSLPEKPKRQRKKKEADLGPDGQPKEKKPRKSAEPKDKTAASTTVRKRTKIEEKPTHGAPRQSKITDMVNNYASAYGPPPHSSDATSYRTLQSPPSIRPSSSGQNYDPVRDFDPVRAATIESSLAPPTMTSTKTASANVSPRVNKASASPSISSLIDPPAPVSHVPPSSYPLQTVVPPPFVQPQSQDHPSTSSNSVTTAFMPPHPPSPTSTMHPAPVSKVDNAMDIDLRCDASSKPGPPEFKAPSKSSSLAPTPKAARPTPPPPKGAGSGLLSSSDLFGGPSSGGPAERKGIDIELHIPLNPQGGNTINIAQEIAKKYGRDALNPRAAAHRERLLQIQAAANKIEGSSADDMSVDLMSELDGDSNVEMGGMDDEKSGTGQDAAEQQKNKRRKKTEEYDKEDDFIDDTELAWQEQAAVAKDGFFVYSGPLIPAGQTAQVESAAPTRGGRGRGRGRGRAAAATGLTHASLAEKARDPSASVRGGRARGRGTGGVQRKPRITKAEKERMDAEKTAREKAAASISGSGGAPLAPAPSSSTFLGNTPHKQQQTGTLA